MGKGGGHVTKAADRSASSHAAGCNCGIPHRHEASHNHESHADRHDEKHEHVMVNDSGHVCGSGCEHLHRTESTHSDTITTGCPPGCAEHAHNHEGVMHAIPVVGAVSVGFAAQAVSVSVMADAVLQSAPVSHYDYTPNSAYQSTYQPWQAEQPVIVHNAPAVVETPVVQHVVVEHKEEKPPEVKPVVHEDVREKKEIAPEKVPEKVKVKKPKEKPPEPKREIQKPKTEVKEAVEKQAPKEKKIEKPKAPIQREKGVEAAKPTTLDQKPITVKMTTIPPEFKTKKTFFRRIMISRGRLRLSGRFFRRLRRKKVED